MDGAAVAIAEPQPFPPRRISDAPSARNLNPRHISAVRRWPPGCGRFPPPPPPQPPTLSDQCSPAPPPPPSLSLSSFSSPVCLTTSTLTSTTLVSDSPPPPEGKINDIPVTNVELLVNGGTLVSDSPPPPEGKIDDIPVTNVESLVNGGTLVSDSNAVPDHVNQPLESPPPPKGKIDNSNHLNQEAVEEPNGDPLAEKGKEKEKEKGDLSNKRRMNSKVYPPPKRRAVSAIRRFPLGCGRKPNFCIGLIDPQPIEPDPISSLVTGVFTVEPIEYIV